MTAKTEGGPHTGSEGMRTPRVGVPPRDSWLAVRLGLLGLAVTATLLQFWPPLTLVCWLLAAVGVVSVLLRRPGRDAVDWVARSLAVVFSSIILLGVGSNALSVPLTSTTWALAFGGLGAATVIGSHLRVRRGRTKGARGGVDEPTHDLLRDSQESVPTMSQDVAHAWRSIARRPGRSLWLLLAAVFMVAAVTIGYVTEPRGKPDLELSLSDPAAASSKSTTVTVKVSAREYIADLRLTVQPASGAAPAEQRFSIEADQSVERVVSVPATGSTRIQLTTPGQPGLARLLTINR